MKSWHKVVIAVASSGALLTTLAAADVSHDARAKSPQTVSIVSKPSKPGLSVLTYNIKGLPWPFSTGRAEAFTQIENRLLKMRSEGTQPHVIVLQEAFTDRAREIGTNSGYRFVADGPSRDQIGDSPGIANDAKFADAASFSKGESVGKWLGSGLQILSDYPILSLRRAAFPSFACAGYDCLANKGALLVTVRVPEQAEPVTIVTTHMNSKRSSGVSESRSAVAYRMQAAALERFVEANHNLASPIIFAGDFNASNLNRRHILATNIVAPLSARNGALIRNAVSAAAANVRTWPSGLEVETTTIAKRGRDWQFFASGTRGTLIPQSISVPFGREKDGTMLSDHMGLAITYKFASKG